MINLKKILQSLIILIALIVIGFTSVSQNTITDYQIQQIRLLQNQATNDSIKAIDLSSAIDTLNNKIGLLENQKKKCNTVIQIQKEKLNLQVDLSKGKDKEIGILVTENKRKKTKLRNTRIVVIVLAILDLTFIYKALN